MYGEAAIQMLELVNITQGARMVKAAVVKS